MNSNSPTFAEENASRSACYTALYMACEELLKPELEALYNKYGKENETYIKNKHHHDVRMKVNELLESNMRKNYTA